MTPPTNIPASQPKTALPNHLQLPETDGSIVENYQESPQGNLLTSSILPRLRELHPDGQFSIGQDSGIYFQHTEPPLDGCRSPDWFYVPNVPPMLDGTFRRSYVMWYEVVPPLVIIEYASGDGSKERDQTPMTGKFWIYEHAIGAKYYAIFEIEKRGVTGEVLPDDVAEFSRSYQRRIMQERIDPTRLRHLFTRDAIRDRPTPWDYLIGKKVFRQSILQVDEEFAIRRWVAEEVRAGRNRDAVLSEANERLAGL